MLDIYCIMHSIVSALIFMYVTIRESLAHAIYWMACFVDVDVTLSKPMTAALWQ